jgi:hypothetical protein
VDDGGEILASLLYFGHGCSIQTVALMLHQRARIGQKKTHPKVRPESFFSPPRPFNPACGGGQRHTVRQRVSSISAAAPLGSSSTLPTKFWPIATLVQAAPFRGDAIVTDLFPDIVIYFGQYKIRAA